MINFLKLDYAPQCCCWVRSLHLQSGLLRDVTRAQQVHHAGASQISLAVRSETLPPHYLLLLSMTLCLSDASCGSVRIYDGRGNTTDAKTLLRTCTAHSQPVVAMKCFALAYPCNRLVLV